MRDHLWWNPSVADAAHLVAVPPILPDHLHPLFRDVLGDGGQKVRRREHLEIRLILALRRER
jgi:hypothetical protein